MKQEEENIQQRWVEEIARRSMKASKLMVILLIYHRNSRWSKKALSIYGDHLNLWVHQKNIPP